jgi:diguanylate cyclase (GGDEF)-like protein/PAS domain S-box-containing protein
MVVSARVRGGLLVLPVATQLIALVVVGVAVPHHISHLTRPTQRALTVTIGIGSTLLLVVASARCRGRLRASWAAMALAAALWSSALFGAIQGWSTPAVWGLLRGSAFGAVATAILISPGVRRTVREWGLLLLDGWLVGISAFLIGWVALRLTTSTLSGEPSPALYWVPLDLMIASAVSGLAVRARGSPATVALLVLAALLTVTSDTTWALTVGPESNAVSPFGVIEWLIALTALGSSTLTRRLDPWSSARPEPDQHPARPRLTRLAQMAMVPGLLAAAAPDSDRITFIAAASLIVGLAVEVALIWRQHGDLWRALQGQAERLEQLLQESRDAIVRLDPAGQIEFANNAVTDVFGHPAGSLVGTSWFDLVLPDDREAMAARLARLDDGDIVSFCRIVGRFRHGNGGWRELESTASRRGEGGAGFTLSVRDVSERSQREADLRRQASTDWLTGLFNRQAFITLLEERLPRGDTHMLFVDLDGFKAVNDTEGHMTGDRLLREVADALRAELRPGDIAARLGGDEFAVLPAVRDLEGTKALAARLVKRIGRLPAQHGTRIGASIGVADGFHDSAESLIWRADLAMYQAKASGGGCFVVFAERHHRPITHADAHLGPATSTGNRSHPAPMICGNGGDRTAELVTAPVLIDLTDLTDLTDQVDLADQKKLADRNQSRRA